VHCLGQLPGGLAQALGCATGGTGERHLHAAGIGQPDHCAEGDGLARAGAAGQDGQRLGEGGLHRCRLAPGEGQARASLGQHLAQEPPVEGAKLCQAVTTRPRQARQA